MPANSANTHRSQNPVLTQSALLAGQLRAETTPEIPLSLLLTGHTRPSLNVTDTRETRDRHEGPAAVLHQS